MKTRTFRNAGCIALLATTLMTVGLAQARQVAADTPEKADRPDKVVPDAAAAGDAQVDTDTDATQLDVIRVTGTRIKGGSVPSPVITIDSARIKEEGFTDLGEVIRSLPQNFSGGQNPGVATSANVSGNNYNTTGGSSMNLRGLGQDATLTLLNGRRMSYGGASQAVDISAIPVEAVERLEILPDGASAVYGSDAVGGVANVILKRDFDGVTAGTRFGGATDGGMASREYTATAGTTWSSGGLMATWKKASTDPIGSDQRHYTRSMFQPATLWPGSELRSGLLSLHQLLGDSIEFHLDALSSERSMRMDTAYSAVYYHDTPDTHTTLLSPSLDLQLSNDWTLILSAALGKDKTSTHQQVIGSGTGAVYTNSIGTYGNSSQTYEIGAEGPLLTLPGGDARLAAGAGYRYNSFLSLGISSNRIVADGDESSRFAYAELSLPVIGPLQGIGGAERLVLTGAIRAEDYRTYGRVTTPKLGVIYSPSPDFTLSTSWGRSFKAPRLLQRYTEQNAYLYTASTFGGTGYLADATVLYRAGGSEDLRPERARTWSASLRYHPEAMQGLEAELTWFDIDYTARIVQPVVYTDALANAAYAGFIDNTPTADDLSQVIAQSFRFYNYSGSTYDASKVVAIVDNRNVNASRQRIKGIDLSGTYHFDLADGRLSVRGSASWLDSSQATISTQSPYDLAGTCFIRYGSVAVWGRSGCTAASQPLSLATTRVVSGTTRTAEMARRLPPLTAHCATTWERAGA